MFGELLQASAYLVWLLLSGLMAITVVGTCKYSKSYGVFFDSLQAARPLEAVQRVSNVYLRALNRFLGPNVGLRQQGIVAERKLVGPYIEHLLLFYWFGATVLVLTFRPVEPPGPSNSSVLQALAFLALLSVNVFTDAWSILWTKRCVARLAVRKTPIALRELFSVLGQDLIVAAALMLTAQIVSNGLYAVQIGRPGEILRYMFDPMTALKPYAPIDPEFARFQFPGQLVITCTTYLPSILFYLLCITVVALKPIYAISQYILDIFYLRQDRRRCNQGEYITLLVAVAGMAYLPIQGLIAMMTDVD